MTRHGEAFSICSQSEATGTPFDINLQRAAQRRAWETLAIAAALIKPGMNDLDGKAIVDKAIMDSGAERLWHASQVRFGSNTMLPFGEVPSAPHVLEPNDVFFIDIGPCYDGHEGDVGRGFSLGTVPSYDALIKDSLAVFEATKKRWLEGDCSGQQLYEYACKEAASRGRTMSLEGASGHRVGDFPHRIHYSGNLKDVTWSPSPDLWILEIHLLDQDMNYGVFYEDIL